jgi:hypothetical protein
LAKATSAFFSFTMIGLPMPPPRAMMSTLEPGGSAGVMCFAKLAAKTYQIEPSGIAPNLISSACAAPNASAARAAANHLPMSPPRRITTLTSDSSRAA